MAKPEDEKPVESTLEFSARLLSATDEERQHRMLAIAQFFELRRKEAGIERQAIADLLEIDLATLYKYEAGREQIPMDDVFTLTNLLNIPPEDVFALISDVYCHQNQK